MIEINLLSIWFPIVTTLVVIILGMVFIEVGGPYEGLFILPSAVITTMVIWLLWFILKGIF